MVGGALEDIDSIAAYIAQDSEIYAKIGVREVMRKTRVLTTFPLIGRIVPEFDDPSIREIFAYRYRIVYRIREQEVEIAAVIHGQQQIDLALQP